jgi:hypothetical protein
MPVSAGDETVPIVVPYLVPQMPQESPIGFMEVLSVSLAYSVVRFLDIERDDAIGVSGHYRGSFLGWAKKIEREAVLRILSHTRADWKSERD